MYKNTTQWLENLITETEAAISRLRVQDQEGFRYLAERNIDKVIKKKETKDGDMKSEYVILNSVKLKLSDNNLIVTRADKGKSVVIINKEELQKKITDFCLVNELNKLNKDPTAKFQRKVKDVKKM
jgi:hypothetical protein